MMMEDFEVLFAILKASAVPVRRSKLMLDMKERGRPITRKALAKMIDFFEESGLVLEGGIGVLYVPRASPELLKLLRGSRR